MRVKDKDFETFIDRHEIATIVDSVAGRLNHDYKGKSLVVCPVLTGACLFAADLMRQLTVDCEVSFVRYASYSGLTSTGIVRCELPFSPKVAGRDVLIVEDVIDSGLSMAYMREAALALNPSSLRICTLFFKPNAFRGNYAVDYVGREIGNEFIVGYGMDYDGLGRNLPDVMRLPEDNQGS